MTSCSEVRFFEICAGVLVSQFTHADLKFKYRNFLVLKEQESLELEKIFNYAGRNYQMSLNENLWFIHDQFYSKKTEILELDSQTALYFDLNKIVKKRIN